MEEGEPRGSTGSKVCWAGVSPHPGPSPGSWVQRGGEAMGWAVQEEGVRAPLLHEPWPLRVSQHTPCQEQFQFKAPWA